APKGKHLLMSHQPLDSKANVKSEAKLGIEDLHELFPDFERHCEILAVQVFKGRY
ncbi:MAG: oxidoreductase, partial [Candidatus Hydrothermarchaeota archaeon]